MGSEMCIRDRIAGAPRPWPPMPVHPSQLPIHQLAVPAVSSGDMGLIFTAIDEIRADMVTHQLSMQDQQAHQEQMAAALLQLTLVLNGPGKKP